MTASPRKRVGGRRRSAASSRFFSPFAYAPGNRVLARVHRTCARTRLPCNGRSRWQMAFGGSKRLPPPVRAEALRGHRPDRFLRAGHLPRGCAPFRQAIILVRIEPWRRAGLGGALRLNGSILAFLLCIAAAAFLAGCSPPAPMLAICNARVSAEIQKPQPGRDSVDRAELIEASACWKKDGRSRREARVAMTVWPPPTTLAAITPDTLWGPVDQPALNGLLGRPRASVVVCPGMPLWRRRRLLVRFSFQQAGRNSATARFTLGFVMTCYQRAGPLSASVENENAENARRHPLDNQQGLKIARLEQRQKKSGVSK